jgi:hypothetical protein
MTVQEMRQQPNWYEDAIQYWLSVDPSVEGMLGGLGHLSSPDVQCSDRFIHSLQSRRLWPSAATMVACGTYIEFIYVYMFMFIQFCYYYCCCWQQLYPIPTMSIGMSGIFNNDTEFLFCR